MEKATYYGDISIGDLLYYEANHFFEIAICLKQDTSSITALTHVIYRASCHFKIENIGAVWHKVYRAQGPKFRME